MVRPILLLSLTALYCFLHLPALAAGKSPVAMEVEQLWESGQKGKAHNRVEKWMKDEKNSPDPWVEAGRLKFLEKKYKATLSLCDDAIKKSPQSASAYYWRGQAYEAMGKNLEAGNEYRAALLIQPGYAEAQEGLDRILTIIDPIDPKKETH